jgi:cob(I)alamin adenosyltransferase
MTSLVGGQRVAKTHVRLNAYGTVDELNSHIGLLIAELGDSTDIAQLLDIQNLLFTIGSMLATDTSARDYRPGRYVTAADVAALECAIDAAEGGLPGWRGFILPGGTKAAAQAHVCRTVCRRAERCIYVLAEEADVDAQLLAYMNRLSDYFFALAKKINHSVGQEENIWAKREK